MSEERLSRIKQEHTRSSFTENIHHDLLDAIINIQSKLPSSAESENKTKPIKIDENLLPAPFLRMDLLQFFRNKANDKIESQRMKSSFVKFLESETSIHYEDLRKIEERSTLDAHHIEESLTALASFTRTPLVNLLVEIVDFCGERMYIPELIGREDDIGILKTSIAEKKRPKASRSSSVPIKSQHHLILRPPETRVDINHYTSRVIEKVLGRDDEQQYLRDFLGGEEKFSWLQLAGVGGQGKSRLALELILEKQSDNNWEAGEFGQRQLEAFQGDWATWMPSKPYLFVIDYIVGNEKFIGSFFQILSQRQDFLYPVRILLLERQPWNKGGFIRPRNVKKQSEKASHQSILSSVEDLKCDSYAEWFSSLATPANDNSPINKCGKQEHINNFISTAFKGEGLWELKPLGDDALFSITKKIVEHEGCKLTMEKKDVLNRLKEIDRSGRPLYAYFLGQALAQGGGRNEDIKSREDLLNFALSQQYDKRWVAKYGQDTPIRRDDNLAHRLAVLATITKGVDYKELKDKKLIQPDDLDYVRRAMIYTDSPLRTHSEHTTGNIILPLEPDILGEWMVLDSLNEVLPVNEIMDISWRHNPKETSAFIQRLTQDFPDHSITNEILEEPCPDDRSFNQISHVSPSILYNLYKYDPGYPFSSNFMKALQYAANEKGDLSAIYCLGTCYLDGIGIGIEQSDERAITLFRRGVDNEYLPAIYNYGWCYLYGRGVIKNNQNAIFWFHKAAEKGHVEAAYMLGWCYLYVKNIKKIDNKDALFWLHKAAEKGHLRSMDNIGYCYANGQGVAQSDKMAIFWFNEAASKDYPQSMYHLGLFHFMGWGCQRNHSEAEFWFRKAVALGHEQAKAKLNELDMIVNLTKKAGDNSITVTDWTKKQLKLSEKRWQDNPLFAKGWQEFTQHEAQTLLPQIGRALTEYKLYPALTNLVCEKLRFLPLLFYPGHKLLDIQFRFVDTDEIALSSAVLGENGVVFLNGQSSLIDALNQYLLHMVHDEFPLLYLMFFCEFAGGNDGPFHIVLSINDIPFINELEKNDYFLEWEEKISPQYICGDFKTEGFMELEVSALKSKTLYNFKFRVYESGSISTIEKHELIADLPILQRQYNGIFRTTLKKL